MTLLPPLPADSSVPPRRVLVVEDHLDTAEAIADLLTLEGHEVQASSTAEQALAVAEEWQPDLVLLDIGLPHMDGYEMAAHLRFKVEPECRFVAVTGSDTPADRHRSRQAGFAAHLVKPVQAERLLALLDGPEPSDLQAA